MELPADEIIGWMAFDLSENEDFQERVKRDNTEIPQDIKAKMLSRLLGKRQNVTESSRTTD